MDAREFRLGASIKGWISRCDTWILWRCRYLPTYAGYTVMVLRIRPLALNGNPPRIQLHAVWIALLYPISKFLLASFAFHLRLATTQTTGELVVDLLGCEFGFVFGKYKIL